MSFWLAASPKSPQSVCFCTHVQLPSDNRCPQLAGVVTFSAAFLDSNTGTFNIHSHFKKKKRGMSFI